MKNSSGSRWFIFALGLFLLIGIFSAYLIYQEGHTYKKEMQHYVELLNFKERLLNAKEWVLGDYEFAERRKFSEARLELASEAMHNVKWYSLYYALGAIAFFIIVRTAFHKHVHRAKFIALTLVCISFLCLITGISVPMLEIGAFNLDLEIPIKATIPLIDYPIDFTKTFDGRLYYYYEIKSITGLIGILFKSNNFVVGIAILLFSIILPAIKLFISLLMTLSRKIRENAALLTFISYIGKWSMADVFVAACFLAYLSFYNMNPGIDTEANTLPGLYFFLAYCMLSLLSSVYIKKAIDAENKLEDKTI